MLPIELGSVRSPSASILTSMFLISCLFPRATFSNLLPARVARRAFFSEPASNAWFDPHGLRVDELVQSEVRQLAPIAALLDAARRARVRGLIVVYEDRPGLRPLRDRARFAEVAGPKVAAQAEGAGVRQVFVAPGSVATAIWDMPGDAAALVGRRALVGQDRRTSLLPALAALGLNASRDDLGFLANSDLAQLAAVRAGLGIGIVQDPLAARDPALVRVLPAFKAELDVWAVVHPDLREVPHIRAVLDALKRELKAYVAR